MGQKVHPIGFRVGISRGWDSMWFAEKGAYAKFLHEDIKLNNEENEILKIGTEINETIISKILESNITKINISIFIYFLINLNFSFFQISI